MVKLKAQIWRCTRQGLKSYTLLVGPRIYGTYALPPVAEGFKRPPIHIHVRGRVSEKSTFI